MRRDLHNVKDQLELGGNQSGIVVPEWLLNQKNNQPKFRKNNKSHRILSYTPKDSSPPAVQSPFRDDIKKAGAI